MNLTEIIRRVGLAIGIAVFTAGFVLLFVPDIAGELPISLVVADIIALGAIILGIWTARQRYTTRLKESHIPDVEFPMTTPTPGDEVDDLIYRMMNLREGTIEYRERIQERVAEIAIAVIMDRLDCSREQAIQKVKDGSWTENRAATSFFGGAKTNTSLLDQLLGRFRSKENHYEKQLRETIAAIEELGEFDFQQESRDDEDEKPDNVMDSKAVLEDDEGEQVTESVRYRSLFRTRRWSGMTAFAFLALAIGILASQPALLLASAVGVGIAGYAQVATPPPLANLETTRTVNDENPEPGEEIQITVTVENTGETFLPDLTLIERIPPTIQVVDGSARLGTALRPGGTASFSYTAIAERGEHEWPLQAIGRDVSGALEREALIEPEAVITCVPRLNTTANMPVRMQTSVYSGEVETEIGGEGLEFFSVRDYQPGDPKRRIDWKTYARTGELSTIDFRKEHAARVVLLFDGRESSYVSPGPGKKHAVDKSVDAAFDVFASLYDQGHLIGISAFNGIPCWLGPDTGKLHLQRVRMLFSEHKAISPLPPAISEEEAGRYVDPMIHIRRQLPENTQIFLFSPLTDEYTYETARQLDGSGHLVTVFSPDPTAGQTVGQRLARLERAVLIKRLRDHGIRVVAFGDDQPIELELEYAKRRWNA